MEDDARFFWIVPAAISVVIITAIVATEYEDFIGHRSTYKAFLLIMLFQSLAILIYSIVSLNRKRGE